MFELKLLFMDTNQLIELFYKRSDALKFSTGLTSKTSEKIVANYTFNVSNIKGNENTISIESLDSLEKAVKEYYYDTNTNYLNKIHRKETLDVNKPMFVDLVLP